MMEVWKDIKNFEGMYQISNMGNVRSLNRVTYNKNGTKVNRVGKIKKQTIDNLGYFHVRLSKDSQTKTFRIHQLVAQAFIDNPNNYRCINHIDEDKTNNSIENLEWCSSKYNLEYSGNTKKACNSNKKQVLQYDLKGNLIKEWESLKSIELELKYSHSAVGQCCRGNTKSSHGYVWKYKNE